MGVNRSTWAVSLRSAACMTRLKRRSNRSRGDIRLMSGGVPPPAAPPPNDSVPAAAPVEAPALAISGATGVGFPRMTRNRMAPSRTRQSAPATIQAVRSRRGSPAVGGGPPAGRPQRWQNRAWGERSARQAAQVRATRLAPQALQKLPDAALPHAGHPAGEVVLGAEAYTGGGAWKRTLGPYPAPHPGISFSTLTHYLALHRPGDRQTWRRPSSGRVV